MTEKRAQWEWVRPEDLDNRLIVGFTGEELQIEIEDEQAVSSYNALVSCAISLPTEVARVLRDFLNSLDLS